MNTKLLLTLFVSTVSLSLGYVAEHEIKSLPGYDGELPSRHFSGYLDVGENGHKHLHYYFVQYEGEDPENAPVVLWMNGGPGCSSLDGWVYEHGPFRIVSSDPLKLQRFQHSWSRVANMIYLEAPVGVGFSYSDNDADYVTNDDKTANDNLLGVEKFFELYPEYKNNDFFITGESYGGVYVPTLAEAIMNADKEGKYTGAPLRGIAVGNGCTGTTVGTCSQNEKDVYLALFLMNTALVSEDHKKLVREYCGDFPKKQRPPVGNCAQAISRMRQDVGHVNLYNVYGECHNSTMSDTMRSQYTRLMEKEAISSVSRRLLRETGRPEEGPVACIDSRLATMYMTRDDVVKALHVKPPTKYQWSVCGNQVKYTSNRENLPRDTYPELIEYLKTTIIYNGDFDACVPYTDNQEWTANMDLPMSVAWHPWTYKGEDEGLDQVAGYAVNYKSNEKGNAFTFATIRGGRHEVPETAPEQAIQLLKNLVGNLPF